MKVQRPEGESDVAPQDGTMVEQRGPNWRRLQTEPICLRYSKRVPYSCRDQSTEA